jgi:hypothetical protein
MGVTVEISRLIGRELKEIPWARKGMVDVEQFYIWDLEQARLYVPIGQQSVRDPITLELSPERVVPSQRTTANGKVHETAPLLGISKWGGLYRTITKLKLVEAVGVEPTSENTVNRELSCFSAFIFVSSASLRTGEDAKPTSLIDLV